jgi:hypothetical protein
MNIFREIAKILGLIPNAPIFKLAGETSKPPFQRHRGGRHTRGLRQPNQLARRRARNEMAKRSRRINWGLL